MLYQALRIYTAYSKPPTSNTVIAAHSFTHPFALSRPRPIAPDLPLINVVRTSGQQTPVPRGLDRNRTGWKKVRKADETTSLVSLHCMFFLVFVEISLGTIAQSFRSTISTHRCLHVSMANFSPSAGLQQLEVTEVR